MTGMYQFSCGTAYGAHGNSIAETEEQTRTQPANPDYMVAVLAANSSQGGVDQPKPRPTVSPVWEGADLAFLAVGLFGFLLLCIGVCFVVSWFSLLSPEKPASVPVPLCQPVGVSAVPPAAEVAAPVASYDNAAVPMPGSVALAPAAALQYGQPFNISTGAVLAPMAALPYPQQAPAANAVGVPANSAYGKPEDLKSTIPPVAPALTARPAVPVAVAPAAVAPLAVVPVTAPAVPMRAAPGRTQAVAPAPKLVAVPVAPMPAYVPPSSRIVNPAAAYPGVTARTGFDAMGRVHTNAYR